MEGKESSVAALTLRVQHTQRYIAAKESSSPQEAVEMLSALMSDMVRVYTVCGYVAICECMMRYVWV